MNDLNANETLVMDALVVASGYQGDDFGFTDDAWREDTLDEAIVSKSAFSGYVSQLQSKGYIHCIDEPEWDRGFYLTQKGARYAGVSEFYAENHPDRT
jgi:hypothetical protein